MSKTMKRYINRELSWLEFNQRVLDEAFDEALPVLERLKFLAISASNLDEFFQVRFGGLQMLVQKKSKQRDPSGMTPKEQIDAISRRTTTMLKDQYRCFRDDIEPALKEHGIIRIRTEELNSNQLEMLHDRFVEEVTSVLAPIAVEDDVPLPHLDNLELNLCVRIAVEPADNSGLLFQKYQDERTERFAIIPIGSALQRFLRVPGEGSYQYILAEEALAFCVDQFFPGQTILECVPFRITRNADMGIREDSAADLLTGMNEVLDAREASTCIRLEIDAAASRETRSFLAEKLSVKPHQVFEAEGPIDLSAFFRMVDLEGYDDLKIDDWPPQPSPAVDPSESIFETLARHDVLLCHPYESFDPVVRLVEEAATDPDVLSIKQTLYRTSRKSPIVEALRLAAENGKNVTALVELKARFDEARNIRWARQLETHGVHVIYGVKGLKTHSKLCIIVRREPHGIQKYMHFGTGNYNEATARIYSDISLMTTDDDLGHDAIAFFNAISGYSQPRAMRKLESAPFSLRDRLLELIEVEKQHHRDGQTGLIQAKVNSLVDREIIDALYEASKVGVKIELNVRGICCLRPDVRGLSENIRVTSIVDRFLEHARIIRFRHGGDDSVFISSADWMERNLDKRVELLVPVESPAHQRRLIETLETYFRDNAKARILQSDGEYHPVESPDNGRRSKKAVRSQHELYQRVCEDVMRAKRSQLTALEPHQPPSADL